MDWPPGSGPQPWGFPSCRFELPWYGNLSLQRGRNHRMSFYQRAIYGSSGLYPDVAAIHVHAADIYGNSQIRGISIADLDIARAAKRLIITTERIISNDEIREDPIRTTIPYYLVDAVCEVPYGSYPGNMAYEYFSDEIISRNG